MIDFDGERYNGSLLLRHTATATREQEKTLQLLSSSRGANLTEMDAHLASFKQVHHDLLNELHDTLLLEEQEGSVEAVFEVAQWEAQVRHNSIRGYAMFLATLSGTDTDTGTDIGAGQEAAVSKHIVDRLKGQRSNPIFSFLERHGGRRTDELAKVLTGFFSLFHQEETTQLRLSCLRLPLISTLPSSSPAGTSSKSMRPS